MKFRLTYYGPLRPTQKDAPGDRSEPLAAHKHAIRKEFHRQLRHLWQIDPFLKQHDVTKSETGELIPPPETATLTSKTFSTPLALQGYQCMPLVREGLHLSCSLDILFLRRDRPGSILTAGDIDNRIKTIIDALRCPRSPNELVGGDVIPDADQTPLYCLLEDDKQVTRFVVDTDTLLDPTTDNDATQAKLVITVELKTYRPNGFNINLGF